jgi:hypothetical protein
MKFKTTALSCILLGVLFCCVPAYADLVSELMPCLSGPCNFPEDKAPSIPIDINSSGWVIGKIHYNMPEPVVGLWKFNGTNTIYPIGLFVSWTLGGTYPVDIKDSGDVLVSFTPDPLTLGFSHAIYHPASGTWEPLADLSAWGPIVTQSMNSAGQYFQTYTTPGQPNEYPYAGARLYTPVIPEPASVALLGTVLVSLAVVIRRRRGA